MSIDPILEPLLAGLPPMPDEIDDFAAFRSQQERSADAIVEQLAEPAPEGAERRVEQLPVHGGSIDLHVFTPSGPGPRPVHIYLHGGGWIGGTIRQKYVDIVCRERAVHADCVVVAVDYRKAPEHRFPAGLDDCYAALRWVADNADRLGVRPDPRHVSGARRF